MKTKSTMQDVTGRRCKFAAKLIDRWAERDEMEYGEVVEVRGDTLIVVVKWRYVADRTYSLPRAKVYVADALGHIAAPRQRFTGMGLERDRADGGVK